MKLAGVTLAVVCVALVAGRSIESNKSEKGPKNYDWEMNAVDPNQIREYLIELSKEPHMAGLRRDQELVEWIAETWRLAGLDSVRVQSYSMLHDYPDRDNPNLIRIYDAAGAEVFRSHFKEEGVDDPNFVDAFNAYSKSGTASGLPVYVNFGSIEDFLQLKEMQVDLNGKVCIARYGKVFRGNIAENAANFGCVAAIIFSDPKQVAIEGTEPEHVYPNDFWLPGTGVQRGSLALTDGDPQTPNWPSVKNAYRLDSEDVKELLPRIPVQPIGYTDAREIISRLGGDEAPADWQGGIPGLVYRIGGVFNAENEGSRIEVMVNNRLEERESSNVVGVLYGSEEPDRYVMFGNHRDAWGFGALDPSSGTAQLMEVVRVLGLKMKEGWRPRRTMMFLSWGSEEYSLMGSREFVEEFQIQLEDRGVAYINTDVCMSGEYLYPASSPTLAHLFKSATKDIWSPSGNESYYDFWKRYEGIPEDEDFEPDVVVSPGAGSDHASFIYLTGVPVMDITFEHDTHKYPNMNGYPAYHTGFETFKLVDEIYDPEFRMFRACAQLNLRLGLEIAETDLLPWRLEKYADVMDAAIVDFGMNGVFDKLIALGVPTKHLGAAVLRLRNSVSAWREYIASLDLSNPLTLRTVNDQIRGFEKTFLLKSGLPDRKQYRHAVIAPSKFDAYGGSAFPGIGDLLYGIDELDEQDRLARVKTLKMHISDLMIVVDRAAKYLQPLPLL